MGANFRNLIALLSVSSLAYMCPTSLAMSPAVPNMYLAVHVGTDQFLFLRSIRESAHRAGLGCGRLKYSENKKDFEIVETTLNRHSTEISCGIAADHGVHSRLVEARLSGDPVNVVSYDYTIDLTRMANVKNQLDVFLSDLIATLNNHPNIGSVTRCVAYPQTNYCEKSPGIIFQVH